VTPAEVRDLLAEAANRVGGVNVAPRWRHLAQPGEGSVRRAGVNRPDNGFGWVATWQVWVMLPSDLARAEEWADERVMDLIEALSGPMVVGSATPRQLSQSTTASPVPCLVVEGWREQD
jgi:hypothetical protein